jgi:hypothetical protein
MTPEQLAAILGSAASLLAALLAIYRQTRITHELVNSRLTELLALTRRASLAEGRLQGPEGPPDQKGPSGAPMAPEGPDGLNETIC